MLGLGCDVLVCRNSVSHGILKYRTIMTVLGCMISVLLLAIDHNLMIAHSIVVLPVRCLRSKSGLSSFSSLAFAVSFPSLTISMMLLLLSFVLFFIFLKFL